MTRNGFQASKPFYRLRREPNVEQVRIVPEAFIVYFLDSSSNQLLVEGDFRHQTYGNQK